MVNIINNLEFESELTNDVPLSVLFTDGSYLDEELFKTRSEKINEFVKLCQNTDTATINEDNVVQSVIKNALVVEFGSKVLDNTEMINTISDALKSDLLIKGEIIDFAKRNFSTSKIDSTLIN